MSQILFETVLYIQIIRVLMRYAVWLGKMHLTDLAHSMLSRSYWRGTAELRSMLGLLRQCRRAVLQQKSSWSSLWDIDNDSHRTAERQYMLFCQTLDDYYYDSSHLAMEGSILRTWYMVQASTMPFILRKYHTLDIWSCTNSSEDEQRKCETWRAVIGMRGSVVQGIQQANVSVVYLTSSGSETTTIDSAPSETANAFGP